MRQALCHGYRLGPAGGRTCPAGFLDVVYGISLDIGTTTMAAHLCNLRTGDLLGGANTLNPQVPFGEDLMSRVSYAMLNEDGVAIMQGLCSRPSTA